MVNIKSPTPLSQSKIACIAKGVGIKDLTKISLSKPSSSISFLVGGTISLHPFLKPIGSHRSATLSDVKVMHEANNNQSLITFISCQRPTISWWVDATLTYKRLYLKRIESFRSARSLVSCTIPKGARCQHMQK